MRNEWCQAQINICGTLCDEDFNVNFCDATTLDFTCTCFSTHSAPRLQDYTGTIPTFECERIYTDCIVANAENATALAGCGSAEKQDCGHLNPNNFQPSTSVSGPRTISIIAQSSGTSASVGQSTRISASARPSNTSTMTSDPLSISSMASSSTASLAVSATFASWTSSSTSPSTSPTSSTQSIPLPSSSSPGKSAGFKSGIATSAMVGAMALSLGALFT